jgi:hypothetical protein
VSALIACASCRRHARVGACPFCGAAVVGAPVPSMNRRAKSRRDVLLFATTLGLAPSSLGCGARTELPEPPLTDAVVVVDSEQLDDAAFDTEIVFDTDVPVFDTSVPIDDGGGVPLYGAAPFE